MLLTHWRGPGRQGSDLSHPGNVTKDMAGFGLGEEEKTGKWGSPSQRLWGRGVASSEDRCKSSQNAESRIRR